MRRDPLATVMSVRARALVFVVAACAAGCHGPGHVQFDGGQCLEDGRPLTTAEVEAEQAEVTRRIASRQPWFAVITIGVVLLAAAGNAERALTLVRGRHADGHRPLVEKLRDLLLRQRDRPAVFRTIVFGSLAVVVLAGGAYVYLDVDKRASERALGMLQFCHLALRTQQEEGDLDEQRRNLQAIESTAGDIRALVGKLPPEQQRKAQLIVAQLNGALDRQGKIVGEYIEHTDLAQKDLSAHTLAMEKGLASVQGELSELKSMPANIKDLEGAAQRLGDSTTSFDARLGDLRGRLSALDAKLDTLLARPACAAPAPASPGSTSNAGAAAKSPGPALASIQAAASAPEASKPPPVHPPARADAGAASPRGL